MILGVQSFAADTSPDAYHFERRRIVADGVTHHHPQVPQAGCRAARHARKESMAHAPLVTPRRCHSFIHSSTARERSQVQICEKVFTLSNFGPRSDQEPMTCRQMNALKPYFSDPLAPNRYEIVCFIVSMMIRTQYSMNE